LRDGVRRRATHETKGNRVPSEPLRDAQTHFVELMAELFQLDEAEALDFGIYRVIRHRNREVRDFLGEIETHGDHKQLVGGKLQGVLEKEFAATDAEGIAQIDARLRKLNHDLSLPAHLATEQREAELVKLEGIAALAPSVREFRDLLEQRAAASRGGDDRLEVLNRLFQFFDRHYQEGDFIVQRRYGRDAQRYIRSTGEDTEFRWATEDMYYIKSGDIFTDWPVKLAHGERVVFAVDAETLAATRKDLKPNDKAHYELKAVAQDGDGWRVTLDYKKGAAKKSHDDAIVAAILAQTGGNEDDIRHWLKRYAARNQSDFFIHKRLGEALNEELDIFLKTDVLDARQLLEGSDRALAHARVARAVRNIGRHIIAFLAALEDFQKSLWEKKKLVLETRYIITLDRIERHAGREWLEAHLPEIIKRQREEWKQLGLGDYKKPKDCERVADGDLLTGKTTKYLPLPVDTGNFDDGGAFKWEMLAVISDIDGHLDGTLFHSDNFQAANLLATKFNQRVDAVYCDPPYNTDAGPISYKNGYKRASWAALVDDRLSLCRRLAKPQAVQCWTIDDYQRNELVEIIDRELGADAIRGIVSIKNSPSGRPSTKGFRLSHEYAIFACTDPNAAMGLIERSASQQAHFGEQDEKGPFAWENFRKRGGATTHRGARPKQFYPIYIKGNEFRIPRLKWQKDTQTYKILDPIRSGERELLPINDDGTERVWSWGHKTATDNLSDLEVRWSGDEPSIFRKVRPQSEGSLPSTIWTKPEYSAVEYGSVLLKRMFGNREFAFPKSLHAVIECLDVCGIDDNGIVLDLFGGSGTTAHAALMAQCKFVLSEANEYFDTGTVARVVKVAAANTWEDGKAKAIDGPGMAIRVQIVEQYEDTLENLALEPDAVGSEELDFEDAATLLRWRLDAETKQVFGAIEHFRSPFGYRVRRAQGAGPAEPVEVDLVESLVWLLGLDVATMRRDAEGVAITGKNRRGESVLVAFRDCDVRGSGDWVLRQMNTQAFDRIYTNDPADLAFDGAQKLESIEAVFATQFGGTA